MDVAFKPAGYEPWKNESPPGRGSFMPLILLGVAGLLVVGGAIGFFISKGMQPAPPPTAFSEVMAQPATSTASPTIDDWSLTGTAILFATASPTLDYCSWLTPTPTASPTLAFTPDAWAATGTAIYEATNPPRAVTPTATTPRSWCDFQTPTITPLALSRSGETAASVQSPSPSPTASASPTATATRTPLYQLPQLTSVPPLVFPTDVLTLPTQAPTLPPPTRTRRTKTPTLTATWTNTVMPPSETPTATFQPTAAPFFNIYQADCAAGYPVFSVQNIGAPLVAFVLWDVKTSSGQTVINGFWLEEMFSADGLATVIVPAANLSEVYTLTIYQPWDELLPMQSAAAICVASPTATATVTLLPEVTEEIQPTATIEVTP